jgi:regulator of cell morphogenesis and NO signaling
MVTPSQSIREIVNSQPRAATILQRFDIDVRTCANASLAETCRDLQLSVEQVLEKLEDGAAEQRGANSPDPTSLSLSRLIQHIVRVHHQNVRQRLPRLLELAGSVAQEHGEQMPEFKQVAAAIDELHSEMREHFRKEEGVLFPYIMHMDETSTPVFRPPQACFRNVSEPVLVMAQEHESAGLLMAELKRLTSGYAAPDCAFPMVKAFYAELRNFAENLREHIRLENEVLFPRAIAREAELIREVAP